MGRPPKPITSAELARILNQVGANICSLRDARGLTQVELAKRAKISITTLNEIEIQRNRDIRISTLLSFAQVLQVPLVRLLEKSVVNDLAKADRALLLKASESIQRIARKLK